MKRRMPPYFIQDDDKYRLDAKYTATTRVKGCNVSTEHCNLMENGQLVLNRGFVWNGPSGPAVDTPHTMMPSAIHDCLYDLRKSGLIVGKREECDKTYREALKNWGVTKIRRSLHFRGVRLFGWFYS